MYHCVNAFNVVYDISFSILYHSYIVVKTFKLYLKHFR